jgi:hypothetical protein
MGDDMYPKRFSTEKNQNIVRLLTLLRGQKCLKKIPNKIIAYYAENPTALSQKAGIVPTQMKDQE